MKRTFGMEQTISFGMHLGELDGRFNTFTA
jgi:hypothetical protein